jgi:hypothetical protein
VTFGVLCNFITINFQNRNIHWHRILMSFDRNCGPNCFVTKSFLEAMGSLFYVKGFPRFTQLTYSCFLLHFLFHLLAHNVRASFSLKFSRTTSYSDLISYLFQFFFHFPKLTTTLCTRVPSPESQHSGSNKLDETRVHESNHPHLKSDFINKFGKFLSS